MKTGMSENYIQYEKYAQQQDSKAARRKFSVNPEQINQRHRDYPQGVQTTTITYFT
jgi:hypothetical protein